VSLLPERSRQLRERLAAQQVHAIGHRIDWHDSLDSTSNEVRRLAEAGAEHGTVVIAAHQHAGRGRRGRQWSGLPGEQLYLSVLLRPQLPVERASELPLLAAVAVAEALEGLGAAPRIKWPNDLELDDRKVCGLLCELGTDGAGRLDHVVLGIGINLDGGTDDFPEELRARATTLRQSTGRAYDVASVAAPLLAALERWLERHAREGFLPVLTAWRARSSTLDARVRALIDGRTVEGMAIDVDATGALLVEEDGGRVHRLVAGEVERVRRVPIIRDPPMGDHQR